MNRKYKRGMICGIIGALITLAGDILIGANPASGITTGMVMLDSFIDAAGSSDIRLVIGGLLGAVGISITGIGYFQLYTLFKNEKGALPKNYKLAGFSVIAFAGAGVHMPCAVIPLLYKWIAPTDEQLAITVAEKYAGATILATLIGHNVFGSAIGTGSISIGHLWMFGMMLWKMPKTEHLGEDEWVSV